MTKIKGSDARELLLTGKLIDAIDAEKIGLINKICEFENIDDGNWEAFSYLIYDTYFKKTGLDMPEGIVENYEISGDEWSEDGDDLEKRYPKLWGKYTTN